MQAKFEGSAEAQAHMDAITNLLADPRLIEWLKSTDVNYFVNTVHLLVTMQDANSEMQHIIDNCC